MKWIKERTIVTSILFFLLGANVPASGGTTYYRWTDERGNVYHSDRPPEHGVEYEVVKTESGLRRAVSADEGAVPAEVQPSAGNEFDQINSWEAQRSKKNPELCERAKTNFETLDGSAEVKIRDDKGEERFMSPEEILVERERARAQITVYCP